MMDGAEKRLQILLESVLDAAGSDAQRREFARLVEQNPNLIAPLIEQMRTHSLLQWLCDEVKVGDLHVPEVAERALRDANRRTRSARRTFIGWVASLAAIVIVGGVATLWRTNRPADNPARVDVVVAEVVDESRVVWSDETTALQPNRLIRPGRLQIESGNLTLRFRSGATVVFRGASSMRIESDMLVRLDRGQATAQVPHWARGFTIETADVEVVDLGTQFGVMASGDGATDVVIFEGEVDLKPTGGRGNVQKRLIQGQAARVASNGAINRIVEVHGDIKDGWSTSRKAGAARSVFAAIRDNIPPSDGTKYFYYQITAGGLHDDAWAYVDRHPHQWNGLTAAGLPQILRGADYARTFNDYRYIPGFEIVVELARPANLYVFFDDRVPTPKWLRERFENTGLKIGLDEGPWEGIPDHRTAVGAGNSIDNVFTVWRRRCERGELVKLGAVGESSEARAMYGIAATPLDSAHLTEATP
jgi:hypothetical protein